jgi:hypothetical protein
MAQLTANATFDDDEGDVAPMVWFGLRRLLDGIDAYAEGARIEPATGRAGVDAGSRSAVDG